MGSSHALQTPRYREFLAKLRRARQEAGLTQVQAAKLINRAQTYVSKSELGERRIDVVELEDFAAAYGVPLTYFATRPGGSSARSGVRSRARRS